jgi:hypothetical protein
LRCIAAYLTGKDDNTFGFEAKKEDKRGLFLSTHTAHAWWHAAHTAWHTARSAGLGGYDIVYAQNHDCSLSGTVDGLGLDPQGFDHA